ncbi:hypothetical protein SUGI_0942050 [Cryptomeria japonica]|nr:hypothetical protein SUGI_0942050 [Cryptomeria japonica]
MCLLLSSLLGLDGIGGPKTKVRNLTDKPLYVQIRVGAILRKAYRVKPGCTKTLSCSSICNNYSPNGQSTFYYDGSCEPYVWIHTPTFAAWSIAKQQYVSLADLEACRVLSVCQDSLKTDFSVTRIYR